MARAGRLNPRSIPYLYLSGDVETAIAEIRPWLGALVTVAKFTPAKAMRVVNLNYRDVKTGNQQVQSGDSQNYFRFILFISQSLARPQDPNDEIAYVPTQYFAEKFKMQGIDGIIYQSVLRKPGSNLVLFDPDPARTDDTFLYNVQNVTYESIVILGRGHVLPKQS